MRELIFDVETKQTFDDVGGYFPEKLDISFVGSCWRPDGAGSEGEMRGFFEKDLPDFFELMEEADVVIGFNSDNFDLPTFTKYFKGNIKEIPSLDLMARIKKSSGHRIGLDAVAQATCGVKKSGHGLDAIRYFREGRLQELADYCLQDVRVTREVYDYGLKNGAVKFFNKWNRLVECPVDFGFVSKRKAGTQESLF